MIFTYIAENLCNEDSLLAANESDVETQDAIAIIN